MEKILIVEDDASIAELECDYLEINNYICDIASNGKAGLEMALNNEYSLIILDIMLPFKNGFEICSKIRKKKDIPIILLSAKSEDIDKIRGLGLGADDYMTKPFSPNELVARVKAHISRYNKLSKKDRLLKQNNIEIRGLRLEKDSRRAYVNNKEINLTAKEFDLLLFLSEHPNCVYSKDELLDKIWGIDCFGDVATVTVHIGRIRDKIEFDSSNPQYIETVWGSGYRFKV